jgi:hypothetical protein
MISIHSHLNSPLLNCKHLLVKHSNCSSSLIVFIHYLIEFRIIIPSIVFTFISQHIIILILLYLSRDHLLLLLQLIKCYVHSIFIISQSFITTCPCHCIMMQYKQGIFLDICELIDYFEEPFIQLLLSI